MCWSVCFLLPAPYLVILIFLSWMPKHHQFHILWIKSMPGVRVRAWVCVGARVRVCACACMCCLSILEMSFWCWVNVLCCLQVPVRMSRMVWSFLSWMPKHNQFHTLWIRTCQVCVCVLCAYVFYACMFCMFCMFCVCICVVCVICVMCTSYSFLLLHIYLLIYLLIYISWKHPCGLGFSMYISLSRLFAACVL